MNAYIYICIPKQQHNRPLLSNTSQQYDTCITEAKDIFMKKTADYGTAWRILRTSSLTDQIFIKASRIRSIEEKGTSKINEPVQDEYIGIVNYCVMALVQLEMKPEEGLDLEVSEAEGLYDKWVKVSKELMEDKNHDYGEAWRDMRVSSMTDLILMKLLRIKQIEENEGQTIISEGLDANYLDIINYAIFALIKLSEQEK